MRESMAMRLKQFAQILTDKITCRRRIQLYMEHTIGWVARPKHGLDGYIRRGKFKKSSNLNELFRLSYLTEERMNLIHSEGEYRVSGSEHSAALYEKALTQVLEELPVYWADG